MQPRVEERVVQARDGGALGAVGQLVAAAAAVTAAQMVLLLRSHIHGQLVQVRDVVRVRSYFI